MKLFKKLSEQLTKSLLNALIIPQILRARHPRIYAITCVILIIGTVCIFLYGSDSYLQRLRYHSKRSDVINIQRHTANTLKDFGSAQFDSQNSDNKALSSISDSKLLTKDLLQTLKHNASQIKAVQVGYIFDESPRVTRHFSKPKSMLLDQYSIVVDYYKIQSMFLNGLEHTERAYQNNNEVYNKKDLTAYRTIILMVAKDLEALDARDAVDHSVTVSKLNQQAKYLNITSALAPQSYLKNNSNYIRHEIVYGISNSEYKKQVATSYATYINKSFPY